METTVHPQEAKNMSLWNWKKYTRLPIYQGIYIKELIN